MARIGVVGAPAESYMIDHVDHQGLCVPLIDAAIKTEPHEDVAATAVTTTTTTATTTTSQGVSQMS